MRKSLKYCCLLMMLIFLLSSVSFGLSSEPLTLTKAYKVLAKDKGKNGYIIGKFEVVHTMSESIASEDVLKYDENVNGDFTVAVKLFLVNQKNKTFDLSLKPLPGSSLIYKYTENKLNANQEDPYWILPVPPGSYRLTTIAGKAVMQKHGYHPMRFDLFNDPASQILKKDISFDVKEKQIIYIGDYNGILRTYFGKVSMRLYPFRQFQLQLTNEFESAKTKLFEGADNNLQEKLNSFEIISAL